MTLIAPATCDDCDEHDHDDGDDSTAPLLMILAAVVIMTGFVTPVVTAVAQWLLGCWW